MNRRDLGLGLGLGLESTAAAASNPMAGVTQDATSGIYVPATAGEWTTTMAAAGIGSGPPSFLWLMADAASPIAEVFGGSVVLATGGTAGSFAQAISGWSRVGWTIADAAAGRLISSSVSLPDPSTTSCLSITYTAVTATPAAERQVVGPTGAATAVRAGVTTTPAAIMRDGANSATGGTTLNTAVKPWTVRYNKTASTCTLFTDADKVSPTFTAGAGKQFTVGESNGTSPAMWCGYAVLFAGAAAELSDAQVKTLLQTLNWTVTWV